MTAAVEAGSFIEYMSWAYRFDALSKTLSALCEYHFVYFQFDLYQVRNCSVSSDELRLRSQLYISVARIIVLTTSPAGNLSSFGRVQLAHFCMFAFQWLKRVDSDQINGTIPFDGERYMVLAGRKNGIMTPRGDNVYLSRLTLVNVSEEHTGLYICSATNTHGYSYRSAYLTVLPPSSESRILV